MYNRAYLKHKGKTYEMGAGTKEVFQFIKTGSHKGTRARDIVQAFGHSDQVVQFYLKSLMERDLIDKLSYGLYKVV